MLNKYPIWKYLLILMIGTLGVIYSLPNLYPPDAAVQITPARSGDAVDEYTLNKALSILKTNGIEYFGEELQKSKTALIRVADAEQQLQAKGLIQRNLGDGFIVALNLAPTTPQWLMDFGAGPMTLGLDLSGGVHFLMEVDMAEFLKMRMNNYRDAIKRSLREEKLRYKRVVVGKDNTLDIKFANEDLRDKAETFLGREYNEFLRNTTDKEGAFWIKLSLSSAKVKEFEDYS